MGDRLEVQRWVDKCAIQELIYRYTDSVNRADWDETLMLYAPDAVWESPVLGMRFETAAAFVDNLRTSTPTTDILVQTASSPVIRLAHDGFAEATTTIHEFCRGTAAEDGPFGPAGSEINFEDYGIYYDEVTRLDGEWKFTHRVFVPVYIGQGCVTGDVTTPRDKLRIAP
jgi:ketosteroid isomerase-like protein